MRLQAKALNVSSALFLAVFVMGSLTSCDGLGKKNVPLAANCSWEREDNFFSSDRYYVRMTIFHKAPQPISGTYVIRAYGDVFGNGGEESQDADNFDSLVISNASPGTSNGANIYYYINNPELQADDLSVDQIKKTTNMTIVVDFRPASSETTWRTTTSVFRISGGQLINHGSLKEFQENGGTLTSRNDR